MEDQNLNIKPDVKPAELEKQHWMLGSTLLNTLLAFAKLGWGVFSGSTVVLADAIHSISDVVGALLVYIAVRFAPHHSKRFPLGLYKLEDMAAVIAGLGVLFAGYEILRSVFVGEGVSASSVPLETLIYMVVIIIVQLAFYFYEKRAAARLKSPGLDSDVANWFGDIGAGLVVIVGVAGHMMKIPYIQEVAVIIIALFIFHSAYEVLRDGLLSLLDASVAQDEEKQAREYLESIPSVEKVSEVIIRKAGSVLFLKATLQMDTQGFDQAHHLVDEIEEKLKEDIPALEKVTIHYEPVKKPYRRIASLYQADRKTPASTFGTTSYILLEDIPREANKSNPADGVLPKRTWISNPYLKDSHGRAMKLAAWLIRQHVNELHFDTGKVPADSQPEVLADLLSGVGITIVDT